MKKRIRIGIGLLVLIAAGVLIWYFTKPLPAEDPMPQEVQVSKGESLPADLELADTAAKRTQGLSGRESLGDDYGMLFIFPMDDRHGFWMKDMKIAIDIIWISAEGSIVHIEHSVSPDTYPKIFTSPNPARYALETQAGYAAKQRWKVGTVIDVSAYK